MPQPRPDGLGDELARGLVDADVQPFDAERLRDLRAGELGQATAAGHATGEAGDQPSVGDGVVRGPLRRRAHVAGGEAFLHREMVEQVLGALGDARTLHRPARWVRRSRTVTRPLPPAANSGQYVATGSS